MSHSPAHESVLLRETLELLAPSPGETVLDATLGGGGHAAALLDATAPDGRLFGIDRDPEGLRYAARRLESYGKRFIALRGNHDDLVDLVGHAGLEFVDRIVFDLGYSSIQMDDVQRGFSFRSDGPLDMRMDPTTGDTAADLLARLPEDELSRILWRFGEERRARAIARAIVERRRTERISRTGQLAQLIEQVQGPAARRFRIHPATRSFQALRIAVNTELERLEQTIEAAAALLSPGGRIVVIAFHSLEDRIVKRTFRGLAHRCSCPPRLPVCACGKRDVLRLLTSRPVRPGDAEVARNPRARSARLRAAERLP